MGSDAISDASVKSNLSTDSNEANDACTAAGLEALIF